MRKNVFILLVSSLMLVYGCGERCRCLDFVNNSQVDITTFEFRPGESVQHWLDAACSDTSTSLRCYGQIAHNSTASNCLYYTWKTYINESSDKKIHICIVRNDLLEEYRRTRNIAIKDLYKIYTYSSSELESLNWMVTYP